MKKKIEKGSEEFQLFMDFWNYRQEYYTATGEKDIEKFCKKMIDEGKKLTDKYANTHFYQFSVRLTNACQEMVEMEIKNGK